MTLLRIQQKTHRRRSGRTNTTEEEGPGSDRQRDQMDGEAGDVMVTSANRKGSAITGSARKMKDNAADWHNLMMRWNKLNEDGYDVAEKIVNMRLSQGYQQLLVGGPWSSSSSSSAPEGGAAELQDECCKLQDVVDKMVAVVTKMDRLVKSQRGIQDLEEFQFGPEGRKIPQFHTWNTKQFEWTCGSLCNAFCRELSLKQTILQEVGHTVTSDLSVVLLSCWLHQPYNPPQTRRALEALLLETGHRPL